MHLSMVPSAMRKTGTTISAASSHLVTRRSESSTDLTQHVQSIRIESWSHLMEEVYRDSWDPELRRHRSTAVFRGCPDFCHGLQSSLIRLSRERDRSAGVTLTVGERRFALVANGLDAWASDAPSDRAIVAALRSGRSMSVEAVGVGGRPFADVYALSGAATAIDAAVPACRGG